MNVSSLIDNPQSLLQNSVVFFKGKEFPVLFFSLFKKKLKSKSIIEVKTLDLNETSLDQLKAELSFTFLGNKVLYWAGNLDDYSSNIQKNFLKLISKYQGPNVIAFFSKQDYQLELNNYCAFSCDIEKSDLEKISSFVNESSQKNAICFFDSFDSNSTLTLDQTILLSYYFSVLGSRFRTFILSWKDKIFKTESSLFTLSSYFFSKDPKKFFEYWYKIKESYPDTFWTVYWIDQSFRAYWFLKYKENKDFKNLKRISFKLSFSFINGDFRKNRMKSLLEFQDEIYQVDCLIKQSLAEHILDITLAKYLNS